MSDELRRKLLAGMADEQTLNPRSDMGSLDWRAGVDTSMAGSSDFIGWEEMLKDGASILATGRSVEEQRRASMEARKAKKAERLRKKQARDARHEQELRDASTFGAIAPQGVPESQGFLPFPETEQWQEHIGGQWPVGIDSSKLSNKAQDYYDKKYRGGQ